MGVPTLAALVAVPAVVSDEDVAGVVVVLLAAAVVGVGLAVYVTLRHEDRLRSRLDDVERERVEFRRAVARLGDTLAATRDLGRLSEVALHEAVSTVGGRSGVFFSVNAARMRIQARSAIDAEAEGELSWGAGVAGSVAVWGRAVVAPRDAVPVAPEPECDAAVAVPLFSRGAIFGVLAIYGSREGGTFTDDTAETLLTLARHTEAAIDNVYLQEETRRLSITDGLTGLWNRREFELRARQEFERAARFRRGFVVILLDVDEFKEINDTWGHHAGDSVLVDLAGRLAAVTREIDTVARYGGDEFALLLPETGPEGGHSVAEKIREIVQATPFEFDGQHHTVSVSVGVATYPADGSSGRRLVVAADEALYRAKRAGRNRVGLAAGGDDGDATTAPTTVPDGRDGEPPAAGEQP